MITLNSFTKKIIDRGWLYSFAILFNRIVPESLFRFRYFHVYQLSQKQRDHTALQIIDVRCCADATETQDVSALTGWKCSDPSAGIAMPMAWSASMNGRCVGGLWIARGEFRETELGLCYRLQDDQQWLYSAFVEKQHRRQGIYGQLLSRVLAESDQKSTFAAINPVNRSSMAAHRRAIADKTRRLPIGRCTALRCLGFSVAWCFGKLSCDRHITFSHRRQPILIRIGSTNLA
jgi:GNAT superfamily N-acetyltransferase